LNEQTQPLDTTALAPQEQRTGMMLAHLLGLLFGIIGALIYWLVNKDKNETPFVQDQAQEVLNFQINVLGAMIISGILMIVVIGLFLFPLVALTALVLSILGAIKANNGESFRYPFIIRLIK